MVVGSFRNCIQIYAEFCLLDADCFPNDADLLFGSMPNVSPVGAESNTINVDFLTGRCRILFNRFQNLFLADAAKLIGQN